MSDVKGIKKEDRRILKQIEEIYGKTLNLVSMDDPTAPLSDSPSTSHSSNIFNFNREDGSIKMLCFDFKDLTLDEVKLGLLGEQVNKLENLEIFTIWRTDEKLHLEWFKNLKKIKRLTLRNQYFTKVPEWLREFNSLEMLDLGGNDITIIPDWLLNLKELKHFNVIANPIEINQENINILKVLFDRVENRGRAKVPSTIELSFHVNIPLENLKIINEIEKQKYYVLNKDVRGWFNLNPPERIYKFKEGQLIECTILGDYYKLESLPENFGVFKNLQKMTITKSPLVSLPESIGELNKLKELDLSNNKLTSLPESFVNLTSITKLNLSGNKFTEIPTQLWSLTELTELNLDNNPFSDEEKNIITKVPDLILKYLKKKATIRVFISHAVIDFEPYRIGALVEYLEKQKEISQVFFCEEDLAGNIDEWMLDAVQKCQLILFIGTNKSVFHSVDCANELQLADKFSIPVIPLKGKDVDWPDLAEKNLSRELGLEYDTDNFEEFCSDVYKYIENFKREIDLMDKEARQKGIMDIYERFRLMLDEKLSEVVRKIDGLAENIKNLSVRIADLENKGY